MEIFVEAGIVLIAFVLGIFTGRATPPPRAVPLPSEKGRNINMESVPCSLFDEAERRQQAEAVNYLINYSADIAYG